MAEVSVNSPVLSVSAGGASPGAGKGVQGEGGLFAQVLAGQATLPEGSTLADGKPLPAAVAQAGMPGLGGILTAIAQQLKKSGEEPPLLGVDAELLQSTQGAQILASIFTGQPVPVAAEEADAAEIAVSDKVLPETRPGLGKKGDVLAEGDVPGAALANMKEAAADAAKSKVLALGRDGGLPGQLASLSDGGDAQPDLEQFVLTMPAAVRDAPAAVRGELAHVPVETGRASAASALQDVTALALRTPVKAQGWDSDLGQKLVWLVGRQAQFAELSLTPPNLGTLEVRLTLSGQEAGAQFFSPNAAVRDALEAALPKLREMMAEAGLSLGQTSVSHESFRDQQQNSEQAGQQFAQGGDLQDDLPVVDAGVMQRVTSNGLVDLYA